MKEQAETVQQLTPIQSGLTHQAQTGYRGSGGIIFMPGVDVATEQRPQQAEAVTTGTKENVEGSAVKKSQSSGKPTGAEEKKEGALTKEEEKEIKRNRLAYELYEARAKLATVESQMQQVSAGRMSLDQLEGCIRVVDRIKRKASKQRRIAAEDAAMAAGFTNVFFRSVSCEKTLKDAYKKKGGNLGGLEHKIIEFFLGTEEENRKKLQGESAAGPQEIRREKPPQEEVFANAKIEDNNERIAKAEEALVDVRRRLGKKAQFSPEERSALIRAHEVGLGEGSVYNYEQAHITEKARILAEAFGKEERRLLMEKAYAGVAVPPGEFATFNAARFAGTPLEPLAQELKNLGEGNFADQEGIEAVARKAAGVGAAPAERDAFFAEVNRFKARAIELQDAEDARRAAARGGGRGRDRGDIKNDKLEIGDLDIPQLDQVKAAVEHTYNPAFRVAAQVDELRRGLGSPRGMTKSEITGVLRTLSSIANTTPNVDEAEEAQRLISAVIELERLVEGRIKREISESQQQGLYGNIPLLEKEKVEIIRQALGLEGNDGLAALEKRFNEYFKNADNDTNNDWREALGNAKQLELDDFFRVLIAAGGNEMVYITETVDGVERTRLLKDDEKKKITEITRKLTLERETRQYLHEVVRLVNTNASTQDMEKMSARFTSDMSDTAYKMKGVTSASHFFENAMYRVMVKYGGYLPYEAMINKVGGGLGEVESIVQDQMKKEFPAMDEWERNRAVAVARGMGMVSVRFFEIAAQGQSADVPLVGWWANQIIKKFAYFRHVHRFNIGQERNTFMYYRIDGKDKRSWWDRTFYASKDFEDGIKEGTAGRTKFFNGQDDDAVYRWFDLLNTFNCGSLWTQTGWRWRDSFINKAGFLAKLLEHDKYNPLAGLGLWIERTKGDLRGHDSHDKIDEKMPGEKERMLRKFGINDEEKEKINHIETKHQRAHYLIEKYLELAVEVSPLKLLNNLPGFRNKVIDALRQEERARLGPLTPDQEKQFQEQFQERLGKTLDSLSTFQEALQRKRVQAWDEHVAKLERGERSDYDLFRNDADLMEYIEGEVRAHRLPHEEGERVIALIEKTKHEFSEDGGPKRINDLMKDLQDHPEKVPFVLGTDDIALDKLSIVGGGPDAIKRRWEDMLASAGAAEQFGKLIMGISHYHNQEDIIKALNDVYSVLQGHDEGVARAFMAQAMEGIIKFYKKDLMARLPFGLGTAYGLITGRASMAEKTYDRGQMAWDELEVDAFIKKAHGLIGHEQEADLREKVGATRGHIVWAFLRTASMFALAGYILFLMKKQADEK